MILLSLLHQRYLIEEKVELPQRQLVRYFQVLYWIESDAKYFWCLTAKLGVDMVFLKKRLWCQSQCTQCWRKKGGQKHLGNFSSQNLVSRRLATMDDLWKKKLNSEPSKNMLTSLPSMTFSRKLSNRVLCPFCIRVPKLHQALIAFILPLCWHILLYNMVLLSMVKSVNFNGKLSFSNILCPSSNHGPLERKAIKHT